MKNNNFFKTYLKALIFIRAMIFYLILAVINGTLGFISSIFITIFSSIYVSNIITNNILIANNILLILIISFGFLRGILRYFEQYFNHFIAFKILFKIRMKILNAINKYEIKELSNLKKGSMISLITSDVETLEVFYAHTISPFFIAILVFAILLTTSILLTGIMPSLFLLFSHILIGFIFPLINRLSVKKIGASYRNNLSNFNNLFLDNLKGINEVNLYNCKDKKINEIKKYSNILFKLNKLINDNFAIQTSLLFLFIGIVSILNLFINHYLLKLELNKIIINLFILLSGFGAVINLFNLSPNLSQTKASFDRVFKLTDNLKNKQNDALVCDNNLVKIDNINNIKINNLSFSYDNQNNILENINYNFEKNNIYGIYGMSGSGKSTLIKLILNYYEIKNGNIIYNNKVNVNDINNYSLYEKTGYVFQNSYLFNDTILNNVKIGNLKSSKEDILKAVKMASFDKMLKDLNIGLDTIINPANLNLSTGEKQRLGIARCFVRCADLIILDEPTSNIDIFNEASILKSIKENSNNKIVIIISHRFSSLSICDKILKLENKTLKEVK